MKLLGRSNELGHCPIRAAQPFGDWRMRKTALKGADQRESLPAGTAALESKTFLAFAEDIADQSGARLRP